ncbi:Nitric oxide dioxygenase [Ruegeria denitrificans]|uniref:Nitric oxide dioxygenase n=1 Tax=Ruegeria denitrificans TaxID=1715692 RepID=A0A0P1IR79_9RHOB|nr:pyridoxamine 5'-phosphate oxidase family protein [Ruegeria denitrificans]CUJ98869.1 Nitric oxide dioxygenase [Ruegeria denitrificans]
MNAPVASDTSPFHAGEMAMQDRVGKREQMEDVGRNYIRPYMPDQHREFFGKIPFLVVGSVDSEGWPWASMVSGRPGFIHSPHDRRLDIDVRPLADDPLKDALQPGAPIGVVGVELSTRRRNRMNATVGRVEDGGFSLDVVQSFGNCPQYIQTHDVTFVREPGIPITRRPADRFHELDAQARGTIAKANSFYVASHASTEDSTGVDVSHRGGRSGFVHVKGNSLLVPDFAGNNFFNTLGNFLVNPQAGLLFPDYQTGDVLMLTGTVEVLSEDHPDIVGFHGASRGWWFHLDRGLRIHNALPFRAEFLEFSPNSLMADDWKTVETRQEAEALRRQWRSLRVVAVQDESDVIRSFTFEATDDLPLLQFEAGQFLTLRVSPEGAAPMTRTYTVSSAPGDAGYRISVKREPGGVVSNHLHDTLSVGDLVEVKAPKGQFFLDVAETRPAVLFAGGVGITPMMSMTGHVMNEGARTRHMRNLTIFHAAQTVAQRAFHADLRQASANSGGKIRYVSVVSQPEEGTHEGVEFDAKGYITPELIRETLPLNDYDFYLCGPATFMQAIYDMLRNLGVRDDRVFAEAFGPAALTRRSDGKVPTFQPEPEAEAAKVKFKSSNQMAQWVKGDPTLLDVAEAQGLTPTFSCRSGSCGSCLTRKIAGKVAYRTEPTAEHSEDEVLICCAVPAKGSDTVVLDL